MTPAIPPAAPAARPEDASLGALLRRAWHGEDAQALASRTRALYLDYIFNSSVGVFISLALYLSWPGKDWRFLQIFMVTWIVYLIARLCAGLVFASRKTLSDQALRRWGRLPILIQAFDGTMLSVLCLFIYPQVDSLTQAAVMASVLVMVGSTAFSLAGHWLALAVYAPPVYLSLAWATWHLGHSYAKPFALFTLGMFGLYLFYVRNQGRTMNQGFALARLNGQLAGELQSKNAQLQELAASRGRLLATVSHDLRQPAHAIGLLTERALMEPASKAFRDTLLDLNGLSQSLSASLATLMDLTRLDAGLVQVRTEDLAIGPLLEGMRVEYAPTARHNGLELSVTGSPAWVHSDPVLLRAILGNLLSNALKYTRQGQVRVYVQEHAQEIQVVVEDTGIGIHPDQLEVIFREFVRLDGSLPGTEGLGLGLSIVRRYAALLSHRIQVQSELDQGSRFVVSLARARSAQRSVPAASAAAQSDKRLQGLRVLVVDNVPLLLKSITQTLSAWGCEVRTAECQMQAVDKQALEPLDIVISDFHLGDREPDGLSVIEKLRSLHGGPHPLPAILMTGDVAPELEDRALGLAVRVLHKPVRPAVLQQCMLQMLDGR
jgi:signal transduction histidine kinase/CheY-like chemotaxis protein